MSLEPDLVPEPQGQVEEEQSWIPGGEPRPAASPGTRGASTWLPAAQLADSGPSAPTTAKTLTGRCPSLLSSWCLPSSCPGWDPPLHGALHKTLSAASGDTSACLLFQDESPSSGTYAELMDSARDGTK